MYSIHTHIENTHTVHLLTKKKSLLVHWTTYFIHFFLGFRIGVCVLYIVVCHVLFVFIIIAFHFLFLSIPVCSIVLYYQLFSDLIHHAIHFSHQFFHNDLLHTTLLGIALNMPYIYILIKFFKFNIISMCVCVCVSNWMTYSFSFSMVSQFADDSVVVTLGKIIQ